MLRRNEIDPVGTYSMGCKDGRPDYMFWRGTTAHLSPALTPYPILRSSFRASFRGDTSTRPDTTRMDYFARTSPYLSCTFLTIFEWRSLPLASLLSGKLPNLISGFLNQQKYQSTSFAYAVKQAIYRTRTFQMQ